MTAILTTLSAIVIPYLVGVLTKFLMGLAKRVTALDAAKNGSQRFVVVLISTVLTAIFAWAGVHLSGSPFDASQEQLTGLAQALITGLSALISAVYAMAAHAGDKADKATR